MPNSPFFNMPFFGSPYYNRNYYNKYGNSNKNYNNTTQDYTEKSNYDIHTEKSTTNKNGQAFLSIFGLDLYFDDILILCILFSLYTEGVKDEMLFICLLLLLLT